MKRVASLVSGLVVVSGALAGCNDGGGAVSVNTSWRLWATSAETFTDHTLSGSDGYDDNVITCSSDGVNLDIQLLETAKIIDENNDGVPDVTAGKPGEITITARINDPSSCLVEVRERSLTNMSSSAPTYRDNCSPTGGCELNVTVEGGFMMGTVRCTQMLQPAVAGAPYILGNVSANGGSSSAMQISLENCDT